MNISKIVRWLEEVLAKSDLKELVAQLGEILIDSELREGLLKEMPVISAITSSTDAVLAVRDGVLLKKVEVFLENIKDIPPEERQQMIKRLQDDESYGQRVGEQLILLLDRHDNMHKPALLGKALRAYIKGEIGRDQLERFYSVIDRVWYSDLSFLSDYLDGKKVSDAVVQGYVNCGLAWSPPGYSSTTIKPTSIARAFLERVYSAE